MENTRMTNRLAMEYVINNFSAGIPDDVMEKLVAMHTSLVKKSANRKPTATQVANEKLKDKILEVLTANGSAMTVTEISQASTDLSGLTNQKITSLVTQLKSTGAVERIVDGKKSTFKVAD